MNMNNPEIIMQGAVAVGSSAVLGHWSMVNELIIGLVATAAFVISNFGSSGAEITMRLHVHKLASLSAAIWANIGRLGDWVKIAKLTSKLLVIHCKLALSRFRCRQLSRERNKLRLQCGKLLLGKSDALVFNRAGCDVSNNAFNGIEHKWPNDPKLSHGANNRKRGFADKRKMKEQPPLAPARC
jgi:hypothetical protein